MNCLNQSLRSSSKHSFASETYQKTKLFERAWMVKIKACLTGLVQCVRTFSNKRYSKVCNFADRFAMRLGNSLKYVNWSFYYWLIYFLFVVHLKMKFRAKILEKTAFLCFFTNWSSLRIQGAIDLNLTVFIKFYFELEQINTEYSYNEISQLGIA